MAPDKQSFPAEIYCTAQRKLSAVMLLVTVTMQQKFSQ